MTLIEQLNIGAAFRRSDYSTSGSVNSYEGDLQWEPVAGLLVRGGYQRAVRAPNIGELFAADSGSQIAFGTPPAAIGDPCDIRSSARTGAGGAAFGRCAWRKAFPATVIDNYTFPTTATAGLTQRQSGLDPETADTYNFGFSWSSRAAVAAAERHHASVDYYNIKISDVISVVPGSDGAQQVLQPGRIEPALRSANAFCQLLQSRRERIAAGHRHAVPESRRAGDQRHRPAVRWNTELRISGFGVGRVFFFNTASATLKKFSVQTLPGHGRSRTTAAPTRSVRLLIPEYKALTTLGYAHRRRVGFGALALSERDGGCHFGDDAGQSGRRACRHTTLYDLVGVVRLQRPVAGARRRHQPDRRGVGVRVELADEHRYQRVRRGRALVLCRVCVSRCRSLAGEWLGRFARVFFATGSVLRRRKQLRAERGVAVHLRCRASRGCRDACRTRAGSCSAASATAQG